MNDSPECYEQESGGMKQAVIRFPLFLSEVVVVCGNLEEVGKQLPPAHLELALAEEGTYEAITFPPIFKGGCYVTYIYTTTAAPAVLAHEATHAAHYILEHIGSVPSYIDDEVDAHMIQYIVQQSIDQLGGD